MSNSDDAQEITTANDAKLVETANRLREQFQIDTPDFIEIHWISSSGQRTQPIPSDQVFYTRSNTVLMPAQVKDDLTVADWKPIMASSLVFEKSIVRKLRWKLLFLRIAPTATFLVLLFALTFIFGGQLILLFVYLIAALVLNAYTARRRINTLKNARLTADQRASDILGKQSLLAVLKKLQSLKLEDVDVKTRPRRGVFRGLPTVAERIENLRSYTTNVKV